MLKSSAFALPELAAQVTVSARTDVGAVRAINEDSFIAQFPLFLVADGMGGHARGDAASRCLVRTFEDAITPDAPTTSAAIIAAITEGNDAVRALSETAAAGSAVPGTTLAGLALVTQGDDRGGLYWMVFNIGDSRIYRWDGMSLTQVSVDHSAVQELIDAGELSPADAEQHPDRNIITRAIGATDVIEADVWLMPAGGRECFVLCSDGLTRELTDAQIASLMADTGAHGPDRAERLVAAAVKHGGRDNVTVVVVESTIDRLPTPAEVTREYPPNYTEFHEDTRPRGAMMR